MGWPRHHGPQDLDRALAALPAGHLVRALGPARFVLGPSGAQVVSLDDGDAASPGAVARLASVVRSALAERAAWVPYVDAFLVTDRDGPCPPATPVPPRLIPSTLVEGPAVLTPDELRRLVACVEDGALDGLDAVAPDPRGHHLSPR